ncbi:P-loop containing nucleoside triphosphate hydrolase protein [Ramicandelaber brevisporus]|nr:P-loop containing nucleoside triphosphate hydrolase protein [Ramicandelaber brevisporus]
MALRTNGCTVVLLGHVGVGKTSICQAIKGEPVSETYLPTIDNDFAVQFTRNNTTYHVNVIDTAGQTQFSTIDPQLLNIDYGFIIVFSQATNTSLLMVQDILDKLEFQFGDLDSISIAIVCNGKYMTPSVTEEGIVANIERAKSRFYRTSAVKEAAGVNRMFQDVVMRMEKKMSGEDPDAMNGDMTNPLKEVFLDAKDSAQAGANAAGSGSGSSGSGSGAANAGNADAAGEKKGYCNIM